MTEKILIALTGGTRGDQRCGCIMDGACLPLAATPRISRELEERGLDRFEEFWFEVAEPDDSPPAGGLWVVEGDLVEDGAIEDETSDDESLVAQMGFRGTRWRLATSDELAALHGRADIRAHDARPAEGYDADAEYPDAAWVFMGAFV